MDINWIWLWVLVGMLPHSIKRDQEKNKQRLEIRALFWQLSICWQQRRCSWTMDIPIIRFVWERLRR